MRAQKITSWVQQIAKKVPVITQLEKRLGMLQGLDPVLEGIVADLDQVTDFSHMITLKSEQIDNMDELPPPKETNEDDQEEAASKMVTKAAKQAEAKADKDQEVSDAKQKAKDAEKEEESLKKEKAKEAEKEEEADAKEKAKEAEKEEEKEKKEKAI